MSHKPVLLHLAAIFFVTLARQVIAIEIQNVETTKKEDGIWRHYVLTTDGRRDERFKFDAHQPSEGRWDLYIMPTDTFSLTSELKFKEYREVIYQCVDRFVADVPTGKVWSVYMCITRDSRTWQDIRRVLVSDMKKRNGPAVAFSGFDHGGAWMALSSSPEIKQIGEHIARCSNRKFTDSALNLDYLIMRIANREESMRTWQDIMKLPDLALDMRSLDFSLNFESKKGTH